MFVHVFATGQVVQALGGEQSCTTSAPQMWNPPYPHPHDRLNRLKLLAYSNRPQRCPEPAFTCKKVPNYEASAVDNVLPSPMFEKEGGASSGPTGAGPTAGQPMARLSSFAKFS